MSARLSVRLVFPPGTEPLVRRRIGYAFQVFCAVYGYSPANNGAGATLVYGQHVQAGYRPRPISEPAPLPRITAGGPRFHGEADWLGEIFEWLSAAHEYSTTQTDAVGRIKYEQTLHGRDGLDPLVPYAAVAMRALNECIRAQAGPEWPTAPTSPWPQHGGCAIAATHDIDFLPLRFRQNANRFLKDAVIALIIKRDVGLAVRILQRALRAWSGDRGAVDSVGAVLQREQAAGMESSWYVLPRRGHRRDGSYDLRDPAVHRWLARLKHAGAEIGLHGSYTSLEFAGGLAAEYLALRRAGYAAVGSRQHWLRYRTHAGLLNEIRAAGGWYDCTFGYRDQPGFRHGACFPFPPYDFTTESAFPVIELPLMLMDATLDDLRRRGGNPVTAGERALAATREFGWGGTSVLWHDTTFGLAPMRPETGELYWRLKAGNDRWMRAADLVEAVWPRYADAGLLPERPPAVTP